MSETLSGFVHRYEPARTAGSPTLLMLHGTGGDETDLLALGRELAPGAGLLSPRGRVLERGMPRFFRRFAEGVFDVEDVRRRAHELAAFVGEAVLQYQLDADSIYAVGFSNGANIAGAVMLLEPRTLRGGVLLRAQPVIAPEEAPRLGGRSALLAAGLRDPIVPATETERLAAALRDAGADVTMHWADAGHHLTASDVNTAREWLAQRFSSLAR